MSLTISQNSPIASTYDHSVTEGSAAQYLAEKLLADGGELRNLERDGLGLDFNRQPGFKEQLVAALSEMISAYKSDHRIMGQLTIADEVAITDQLISKGRSALAINPALSENLQAWLSSVVSSSQEHGMAPEVKPAPLDSSFRTAAYSSHLLPTTKEINEASEKYVKLKNLLTRVDQIIALRSDNTRPHAFEKNNGITDKDVQFLKDNDLWDGKDWDNKKSGLIKLTGLMQDKINSNIKTVTTGVGSLLTAAGISDDYNSYQLLRSIALKLEQSRASFMVRDETTGEMKPATSISLPKLTDDEKAFLVNTKLWSGYNESGSVTETELQSHLVKIKLSASYIIENIKLQKKNEGLFTDSISETDGRNVWDVYESKLEVAKRERDILYGKLQKSIKFQEALNSYRSRISLELKNKEKEGGDHEFSVSPTAEESKIFAKNDYVPGAEKRTKNQWQTYSEDISNKVKQLSDESQLTTTDMQDAIGRYNNITEAISKLVQKMYEASKDFLR